MFTNRISRVLLIVLALATALSAQTAKRPIKLDDIPRLREVRDPQLSPDGQTVAFVVSAIDAKEDKSSAHIWMVGYDGKGDRTRAVAAYKRAETLGDNYDNAQEAVKRYQGTPFDPKEKQTSAVK